MSDYITIPLSKRGKHAGKYIAIVDSIDADLDLYNWTFRGHNNNSNVYAVRRFKTKLLKLHRVILARKLERDLLPTEFVDHINGNGLDNRRENLRLATRSQNGMNRKKHKNNTSGYKGVIWSKKHQKWEVRVSVNKVSTFFGYFDTKDEAYKVYCNKAKELYGEFANLGNEE